MPKKDRFCRSSVGRKILVALSGVVLSLFLVGHLSGNLLLYGGEEVFNHYAASLQSMGPLLWGARAILLFCFLMHVVLAVRLNLENRKARPLGYQVQATLQASFASRTMVLSGALVFLFLLYHLAHLTFHWIGDVSAYTDSLGRHNTYQMVVSGFRQPVSSLLYIVAMVVLGLHLSHGLSSLFQSLGLYHRGYVRCLRYGGIVVAWLLSLGFISLPLSVWLGVIG